MRALMVMALALGATLSACKKDDDDGGKGEAGFDISPDGRGFSMTLNRDAIGKTYLLSPAVGSGFPLPNSESFSLLPRVVVFQLADGDLYLFEDATKQVATASLPAYELLARFDVDSVDDATVTFDFNSGIQAYLVRGMEESYGLPAGTLEIQSSYMNKVYIRDGMLFADQVLDTRGDAGNQLAQVKYTLEPYTERTDFASRNGVEAFKKVGYFTNLPLHFNERGQTKEYINKWDVAAPITFHLSPSIPEAFRQATKDGILYWNKAFGKDVLAVADLPEGVTPHEPGYNVVQWIESDQMGGAYADFRTDPRTGEILQAQVFMSNVFTDNLQIALATDPQAPAKPATQRAATWRDIKFAPTPERGGKSTRRSCFQGYAAARRETGSLLAMGLSAAQVEVYAADIVRMVIAHEIGHVLGLRHNFTAKNGGDLPVAEFDAALTAYLADGTPPAKSLSTSVMDYTTGHTDAMIGGQIRAGAAALKYDQAAITWGYTTADFRTLDFGGGFCTDDHIGVAPDCNYFTQSGDVIAANFNYYLKTSEHAARNLLGQMLAAKVPPDLTDPIPFDELPLAPEADAFLAAEKLAFVVNALRDNEVTEGIFFRVHDTFKVVTSLNREAEEAAILAYQKQAVKAVGGIDAILSPLRPAVQDDDTVAPALLADLNEQFAALLARPEVLKNTTARGQSYELSAEDVKTMKAIAKTYFAKFAEDYLASAVQNISGGEFGSQPFAHFDLSGLAKELKALGNAVILAEGESVTGTVNGDEVSVKAPYYKVETMTGAASLFSSSLADVAPDTFNEGASGDASADLATKLAEIDRNGAATTADMPEALKQVYHDLTTVKDAVDSF